MSCMVRCVMELQQYFLKVHRRIQILDDTGLSLNYKLMNRFGLQKNLNLREMVQRLKINQFYAAPTALRLLLRYNDEHVTKYDKSSLKVLGSVGEPINTEAWQWFYDLVGEKRCKIADTWWQTETGGACKTINL